MKRELADQKQRALSSLNDKAASDKLVEKPLQIISFFGCAFCIENPANSRLWGREVAEGLIAKSIATSYCSFGYCYRKNTRLASNYPLVLPKCPGAGLVLK